MSAGRSRIVGDLAQQAGADDGVEFADLGGEGEFLPGGELGRHRDRVR